MNVSDGMAYASPWLLVAGWWWVSRRPKLRRRRVVREARGLAAAVMGDPTRWRAEDHPEAYIVNPAWAVGCVCGGVGECPLCDGNGSVQVLARTPGLEERRR